VQNRWEENMNHFRLFAGAFGIAATIVLQSAPAGAFVTFESGQVRPLAKSPDGSRLFVCNTPDNRLEIFDIDAGAITFVTSVPVGLEPVAVAARTNTEVWVVNHLSDSVSIVDISDIDAPRVTRSLTVGDEPRDIVFAGAAFDRAFVTTAHRGQNIPIDPQLTTEGVGRADVWVFDTNNLGSSFGGDELTIVTLFGDTPRPLAVSPDGSRVYAGVFFSGNQTTVLGEGHVANIRNFGGTLIMPRPTYALPLPDSDVHGVERPEVGLIVKWNGSAWVDENGLDRSSWVRFDLPDYDVFAIDATANPPIQVAGTPGRFPHVGTTLFNMAVNPANEKVYVTNLEAFNEVRFEGPGEFADSTVRGHIVESRITVIDPDTETVTPIHLNKHIDYNSPFDAAPNPTNEKSLAFPLEMQFTADGSTLFVAALGSSKIGMYDTAELESDTFVPDVASQIPVSGGGPTGLVLDEANSRLYVLTRFDNSVSVVSTATGVETQHVALHNPEPASVVAGRPFLYDATHTSSRGDQACASCHIFGDMDGLAWDLGNPDDETIENQIPFIIGPLGIDEDFHPMKGPMTTQSLRGMDNHGPMHWRGDRNGRPEEPNSQPDGGVFDEVRAFMKFNPAFVGLIGRSAELATDEMQSFTDFILQVMYPPNPNRSLDNSLTPAQASAQNIYFNRISDTKKCNDCHVFNRNGNPTVERPGFFGSDGRATFENETQMFKVAHLRNLYQKVGMFGMAPEAFVNSGDNAHKGDQIRGFGFLHDGSIDTVFRFFQATVFNNTGGNTGFTVDAAGDLERRDMESFMLAFDSNHRPIVGQQATLSPTSGVDADTRVDLILDRADAGECDAVVKGIVAGEDRGWVYDGAGQFSSDRAGDGVITEAALRALADTAGQELTFTAVPEGEGLRIGVDRDLDGFGDIDEVDGGSDPTDVGSLPCTSTESSFVFRKAALKDSRGKLIVSAEVSLATPYAASTVSVAALDGGGTFFSQSVLGSSFEQNNSGTTWSFKAEKGVTGVTRVKVKSTSTPGLYRVTVKTNGAWTPPAADETIATTTVELQIYDECFTGPATKITD
jgi:DNA-binding beta-propeller fold protein YncE